MFALVRHLLAWTFRPFTERNKGNLRLVGGCLCLSALIWVFNSLNKVVEAKISVPLKIQYNSNSFVPIRKIPKTLTATVVGHGWQVFRATSLQEPKPVIVWIKHPGLHSQLDTVVFREYIESHMGNIKVKHVLVDSVALPFDIKGHKWVHMKLDSSSISVANGYKIDSLIRFKPDSVLVTGPQTHLRKIADTLIIQVPFKNLDKDFDESFKLGIFLHNPLLKLSEEKVNVRFKVRKKPMAHGK